MKTYEKSLRHQNLDTKNTNLNLDNYKLIQTQIFSKNKRYLDAATARMSFWYCFDTWVTHEEGFGRFCAPPPQMSMFEIKCCAEAFLHFFCKLPQYPGVQSCQSWELF